MKPAEARLVRALDAADPAIRLYLFYGPDEAGARALAARLGKAMGEGVERVDFTSSQLKSDPARLADEAASISMFGGRRWIRLDPATDDAAEAVAALLEASAAGNPAVAIGPGLRKDSKLVKAATASDAAIVHACYAPEGRDADGLAAEMGRALGLSMRPDVARRLVAAASNDRAVLAQELKKLALYVDAAPDQVREIGHEALDALGAGIEEGDLTRLAHAVFGGEAATADSELKRLTSEGIEGVPVLRALSRRALLLAQLRGQMEGGEGIDRVMETAGRAIFWKETAAVRSELSRWTAESLSIAIGRLGEAERRLKTTGYAGSFVADEEILAISRHAARRR
ncbi:DNA polymerase III subunit delta [Sphingomonas sp. BIUV-7]|uniref:DNA-directed DNA polymerase n=1 Tax=Sphingomonas natans TaxID=3063330 RepID=A0ABT8YCE8_9SPHN|nr:DNA polymerase III subunit delta [Sphingomonas sp. BIUV-7]MDO6416012.1 DNA polymerase III subunit delta [Sphingomonas sp. BIUV-7]